MQFIPVALAVVTSLSAQSPAQTPAPLTFEVTSVKPSAPGEPFHAVGVWYEDFAQVSDSEVRELLERTAREHVT